MCLFPAKFLQYRFVLSGRSFFYQNYARYGKSVIKIDVIRHHPRQKICSQSLFLKHVAYEYKIITGG